MLLSIPPRYVHDYYVFIAIVGLFNLIVPPIVINRPLIVLAALSNCRIRSMLFITVSAAHVYANPLTMLDPIILTVTAPANVLVPYIY